MRRRGSGRNVAEMALCRHAKHTPFSCRRPHACRAFAVARKRFFLILGSFCLTPHAAPYHRVSAGCVANKKAVPWKRRFAQKRRRLAVILLPTAGIAQAARLRGFRSGSTTRRRPPPTRASDKHQRISNAENAPPIRPRQPYSEVVGAWQEKRRSVLMAVTPAMPRVAMPALFCPESQHEVRRLAIAE